MRTRARQSAIPLPSEHLDDSIYQDVGISMYLDIFLSPDVPANRQWRTSADLAVQSCRPEGSLFEPPVQLYARPFRFQEPEDDRVYFAGEDQLREGHASIGHSVGHYNGSTVSFCGLTSLKVLSYPQKTRFATLPLSPAIITK
jgi:hypothetical protein